MSRSIDVPFSVSKTRCLVYHHCCWTCFTVLCGDVHQFHGSQSDQLAARMLCCLFRPPPVLHVSKWKPSTPIADPHSQLETQLPYGMDFPNLMQDAKLCSETDTAKFARRRYRTASNLTLEEGPWRDCNQTASLSELLL